MAEERALNILCISSYEKGQSFIQECKRQGCYTILITADRLREAGWPFESIDEFYTMPGLFERQHMINTISYLARSRVIDRIVALDDYDVEMAATLREHLRVPGMGDTTARYFRDKLAMRMQADEKGILVPPFVPAINYDRLTEFMERVPPPWVLKPRSEASSIGIHRVFGAEELRQTLDSLGDRQSYFVLEKYIPGDVYHVDAIVYEREVLFAEVHKYGSPPLNVMHDGGLFTSRTLPRDSADAQTLLALQKEVLHALNYVRGISHTEFIKGRDDGRLYFLETAARVGGAYLSEMIDAATGLDLWAEWAKLEIAGGSKPYTVSPQRDDYAGIIISLARQEWPDTSAYDDPEIAWRLKRLNHAGLVVVSPDPERVEALLAAYTPRFYNDFFASQPAPDKAPP